MSGISVVGGSDECGGKAASAWGEGMGGGGGAAVKYNGRLLKRRWRVRSCLRVAVWFEANGLRRSEWAAGQLRRTCLAHGADCAGEVVGCQKWRSGLRGQRADNCVRNGEGSAGAENGGGGVRRGEVA
jgi:hypothetical protein